MNYRLELVTAPTEEPISLEEAKLQCRIDEDLTADDQQIRDTIKAARVYCENFRRQKFITQTWDLFMDSFPGSFTLPIGPVQSITGVYYTPDGDSEQTVNSSNYVTDLVSQPARIVLATAGRWPSDSLTPVNGVKVRFVAGYGAATAVPDDVKAAIKLLVGHLYENREEVTVAQGLTAVRLPLGIWDLMFPDRVIRF